MRNFTHLALAVLAAAFHVTPASAGALPPMIGYTLYVDGVRVGHSGMKIRREGNALHFESTTRVELGPNVIALKSRTEADPETFAIRRFSYEGTKGGMATATEVVLRGDSAVGWVQSPGAGRRNPRSEVNRGGFVVFEDWVMDLEVLLALRQAGAAANPSTWRLLFANSFLATDLVAGFTGQVTVESETRSMTARKMEILFSGATPFESHVDPATGVPVYLHFPGTRTEAFRDDFFGDNPVSRYPGTPTGRSAK
ncbi:MAG TPA: hypothetical protein VFT13_06225 [Candidatus Krumholzibacteria bacterium]|nr:hypothetical protein [Candidatus Krumholzibacteria bacterium]